MIFLKDEGVGGLEEWGNLNWIEPHFEKNVFEFLGQEKTKTQPSFPHVAMYHLPS